MPVAVQIRGADKLGRVSKALREAGAKGLKKELLRGINKATKPLRVAAKVSAATRLPRRGGLAKRMAKTRMSTKTRTGRDPSVRISAAANAVRDPLRVDRGRIKHPVFGRGPWVLQDVTPGWFRTPLEKGAPIVRPEIIQAMDDVAEKIAHTR